MSAAAAVLHGLHSTIEQQRTTIAVVAAVKNAFNALVFWAYIGMAAIAIALIGGLAALIWWLL